ncbi:MAG: hypothetical protein NUV42_01450 [Candidatus Yonathbacteria bacterium]|nr:hypothetical protein [Candidatus Yonathbacteria bacterium]
MNTLIIGMTIGLIGKVMLGVAVIRVHMHLAEERKIDGDVIRAIRREKYVTATAIFLMIAGYLLETAYFMGFFA